MPTLQAFQNKNLVAGTWRQARGEDVIVVRNPATDEELARVPSFGAAEVREAIDAADKAQRAWAAVPAPQRASLIRRLGDLMIDKADEIALVMTLENGKPIAESQGEVRYAASFLHHAAGEAERVLGEIIPSSSADKRILVLRQPVGTTASITPWNFPAAMITRKLAPALAAGCSMIIKPAEQTPLTALAIGELLIKSGIPPELISIITGDGPTIGRALFDDFRVRKVSFTGSTEVGQVLVRQSAQHLQRLSLELGGHAPFVVFDDASVERAAAGALGSKYRNAGQTCICANRFIVHRSLVDRFGQALAEGSRVLRVGLGTQPGVQVGPLIDDAAAEKVERHVQDARDRGARVLCGGRRARPGPGLSDRFYEPTVLAGVTREMVCMREETFGPVAPIIAFDTEDEAIALANDSPFGLAGYFYTSSASRLMRVAERLEYGIVGANDALPSTAQAPFGGIKMSGYGREGGHAVMAEYLNTKYISWNLG